MNTSKTNVAAILAKGLLGNIPFIGPLVTEIINEIIPNQRLDRIESTLRLVEAKILENDQEKVKQRIFTSEYVDLMEDGFWQAARALSEERKDYIASLLKNSLTDDELKYIEYKRLMFILGELNDIEILILKSKSMERGTREYREFYDAHKNYIAWLIPIDSGATQEEIDRYAIHKTYNLHLTNLGLLKGRFKKTRQGEIPEFDKETGMIKAENYGITMLGMLLLRSIDQAVP